MLKKFSVVSLSTALLFGGVLTNVQKVEAETSTETAPTTFLPLDDQTIPDDSSLSDTEEASKIKIIHTGMYIKTQGYMTNAQLKKYVKTAKKKSNYVESLDYFGSLVAPLNWPTKAAMGYATLLIGQNKSGLDILQTKADQGYGMGYALGAPSKYSYTSKPFRTFSKQKVVYRK